MGLKLGITMLIHNKDDIQFVTEFLCFLGHPVFKVEKLKREIYITRRCYIFGGTRKNDSY